MLLFSTVEYASSLTNVDVAGKMPFHFVAAATLASAGAVCAADGTVRILGPKLPPNKNVLDRVRVVGSCCLLGKRSAAGGHGAGGTGGGRERALL